MAENKDKKDKKNENEVELGITGTGATQEHTAGGEGDVQDTRGASFVKNLNAMLAASQGAASEFVNRIAAQYGKEAERLAALGVDKLTPDQRAQAQEFFDLPFSQTGREEFLQRTVGATSRTGYSDPQGRLDAFLAGSAGLAPIEEQRAKHAALLRSLGLDPNPDAQLPPGTTFPPGQGGFPGGGSPSFPGGGNGGGFPGNGNGPPGGFPGGGGGGGFPFPPGQGGGGFPGDFPGPINLPPVPDFELPPFNPGGGWTPPPFVDDFVPPPVQGPPRGPPPGPPGAPMRPPVPGGPDPRAGLPRAAPPSTRPMGRPIARSIHEIDRSMGGWISPTTSGGGARRGVFVEDRESPAARRARAAQPTSPPTSPVAPSGNRVVPPRQTFGTPASFSRPTSSPAVRSREDVAVRPGQRPAPAPRPSPAPAPRPAPAPAPRPAPRPEPRQDQVAPRGSQPARAPAPAPAPAPRPAAPPPPPPPPPQQQPPPPPPPPPQQQPAPSPNTRPVGGGGRVAGSAPPTRMR